MNAISFALSRRLVPIIVGAATLGTAAGASKHPKKSPEQLRQEYMAKVAATWSQAGSGQTTGSIWSADGVLSDGARDYKAHALHDVLTIAVSRANYCRPKRERRQLASVRNQLGHHRSARWSLHRRSEPTVRCTIVEFTEGARSNRIEHDLCNQPHRRGHRRSTERTTGGGGPSADRYEQ